MSNVIKTALLALHFHCTIRESRSSAPAQPANDFDQQKEAPAEQPQKKCNRKQQGDSPDLCRKKNITFSLSISRRGNETPPPLSELVCYQTVNKSKHPVQVGIKTSLCSG